MRFAFLAGILAIFLLSDAAVAGETGDEVSKSAPAAAAEKARPGEIHHIDTGMDDSGADDNMRPEDYEGKELPPYESYDPNTGLTDNVPSDAVGNLN